MGKIVYMNKRGCENYLGEMLIRQHDNKMAYIGFY